MQGLRMMTDTELGEPVAIYIDQDGDGLKLTPDHTLSNGPSVFFVTNGDGCTVKTSDIPALINALQKIAAATDAAHEKKHGAQTGAQR
ncbi:hypothetical protein [Streptomyces sp. AM6-12]|uniref:hypothetical protein n=1 Tax=Streptomyces sp. AM6-12 TaxID=3345149 RepID=UPI00378C4B3D